MNVSFNIRGYVDRRTQDLKERGDAIEIRRTPEIVAPKPITVKPVSRPIFRNTHISDYGQWSVMNLQALTDYWNSLLTADGAGPLGEDDFFIFCRIQHERELDQREEYKRCYGSMRDTL
jgi:hypothetical protein